MAYIIVESGATKTKWLIISKDKTNLVIETAGFNPNYHQTKALNHIIESKLLPKIDSNPINNIFFYGSGLSNINNIQIVRSALLKFFNNANLEIEHDLLATARGLLHKKAGIACILGTGSNSCVYNGSKIIHQAPSLGYFFADEGSGSHIGKLFIEAYLRNQTPKEIVNEFIKQYGLSNENILKKIYSIEQANKFLSSFSLFVSQQIQHPFMEGIVIKAFKSFFETYLLNYPNFEEYPLVFSGSVAYGFQNILTEIARSYSLNITNIQKDPVEGLLEYHQMFNEHTY